MINRDIFKIEDFVDIRYDFIVDKKTRLINTEEDNKQIKKALGHMRNILEVIKT